MTSKLVANPTLENIFAKMVVVTPKMDTKAKLAAISKERQRLEKIDVGKYYAFEDMEGQVNKSILKLDKQETHIKMGLKGYKELDYSFLSWRKKDTKLPAFIIIGVDSEPTFTLSVQSLANSTEEFTIDDQELPEVILDQYLDTAVHLGKLSHTKYDDDEIEICAEFRGSPPRDARKALKKAEDSGIFDSIFIVAEAPKWEINRFKRVGPDPWIVGWIEESEQMFIIATFDATDLEKDVEMNHAW